LIVQPALDNGVERSIFQTGTYEEGTLAVFSELLRPGDVVLDVGANIGLMTLHAAHLVGKSGEVFCFEPMPDILEQLSLSVELNDVPQVRICPFALGARPTILPIYGHPEINRGSSSFVHYEERTPAAVAQVVKLDDFVAENIHKPIRLIKIDVEGWELEVLIGAEKTLSRTDAPILCVECSDLHPLQGGTIGDLYAFIIRVNDYRCFTLERGKARLSHLVPISHSDQLPHHDNLFCFPLGQSIPALMAIGNGD
jgi:FkbM family methyltransferase